MSSIYMVNLTSVGIFGMVLSAFFCDIRWTRKKIMFMTGSIMAILLLQGIIYLLMRILWRTFIRLSRIFPWP